MGYALSGVLGVLWLGLSGLLAWLIWVFLHIAYLIGFRNRIAVTLDWTWSYLTFERGARLITGDIMPASGAAKRDREAA